MIGLPYGLIDMILLENNNYQIPLQLCRMYVTKKICRKYNSMHKAIINNDLNLIKILHRIGHSKFDYCQIRNTRNRKIVHYLQNIAESNSNINKCLYYQERIRNPHYYDYFRRTCQGCRIFF
jgi:hypothetical protein